MTMQVTVRFRWGAVAANGVWCCTEAVGVGTSILATMAHLGLKIII